MTDAGHRVLCCVPFCRRTMKRKHEMEQFICANHWRLVPRRLRRLFNLAKRRERMHVARYLWDKCKSRAIEAAGGIS